MTAVEGGTPSDGLATGAVTVSSAVDDPPEVVVPEVVAELGLSAARFFKRQCRVRRGRAPCES